MAMGTPAEVKNIAGQIYWGMATVSQFSEFTELAADCENLSGTAKSAVLLV